MAKKFPTSALFLFAFASVLWGGSAVYLNFAADPFYPFALDGVSWKNAATGLLPLEIAPHSPADHAGLLTTDTLLFANGISVSSEAGLQEIIDQAPAGKHALYAVRRGDRLINLEVPVIHFRTLRGFFNSQWLKKYDLPRIERQMANVGFRQRVILSWFFKPVGILLILLSFFIYLKKPDLIIARLFFLTGLVTGFGFTAGNIDAFDLPNSLRLLFFVLVLFYIHFTPPLVLDFFRRLLFFSPSQPPPLRLSLLTYLPSVLGYMISLALLVFALVEGRAAVIEPPEGLWGMVEELLF
ncbi:MAG: hypothetical protein ACREBV_05630, partial [Candidatus Zixiibacteriota bacterium]